MGPRNLFHDDFEKSKTLQKWLGISYKVTNEDPQPKILKVTITEE